MKFMKVFLPILIIATLMFTMTAFAGEADYVWPEEPTETFMLVTANTVKPNSQCGETLIAIDEALRAESNGAVGLDIFWDGTLGSSIAVGEACAAGTVDIGLVTSAVISNYASAIDAMSLPFIIRDRDHVRAIIDTCFDEVTAGIEETLGTPMGIWEYGYHHLFTREKEVTGVADFSGLTIRVMEGKIFADTFELLGAIPTNIALSELVTALQQGVVDGTELSLVAFVGEQGYNFCKYMDAFGFNYSVGCPILTKDAEDRYPEEVINLVKKVFNDFKYYSLEAGERLEEGFLQTCIDNGVTVHYPDEAEFEDYQKTCQPVWDSYTDRIGADLIDMVVNAK